MYNAESILTGIFTSAFIDSCFCSFCSGLFLDYFISQNFGRTKCFDGYFIFQNIPLKWISKIVYSCKNIVLVWKYMKRYWITKWIKWINCLWRKEDTQNLILDVLQIFLVFVNLANDLRSFFFQLRSFSVNKNVLLGSLLIDINLFSCCSTNPLQYV